MRGIAAALVLATVVLPGTRAQACRIVPGTATGAPDEAVYRTERMVLGATYAALELGWISADIVISMQGRPLRPWARHLQRAVGVGFLVTGTVLGLTQPGRHQTSSCSHPNNLRVGRPIVWIPLMFFSGIWHLLHAGVNERRHRGRVAPTVQVNRDGLSLGLVGAF